MEHRKLGKAGTQVSALGLGCMGMSFAYGPTDDAESLQVLRRYLELGGNFLDTAEIYGPYKNEELLGRSCARFLATASSSPPSLGFASAPVASAWRR